MLFKRTISMVKSGCSVMLYDSKGREEETDLIIAAEYVTAEKIRQARQEAGGLICVAISSDVAEKLGIPFMTDVLSLASYQYPNLSRLEPSDIPYGDMPSFSITVNHRKTFTGITDDDRMLTIRELAKIAGKARNSNSHKDVLRKEFGDNFRSPGHVHILIAHDQLIKGRKGHTEYSVALSEISGVKPAMMICEMLDNRSGKALSKNTALEYAKTKGIPFIEGRDITLHTSHVPLLR